MDDEAIDHLDGLGYARDDDEALALVGSGEYDAAFFMRGTPIEQVRAIAASGENMPPKSRSSIRRFRRACCSIRSTRRRGRCVGGPEYDVGEAVPHARRK